MYISQTALVFDSAVASLEVVGCQSVQVQVMKNVPIVNVDKTDGFQIFLPREAVGVTEFITAKSSEMNIVIPGATDDDDIVCSRVSACVLSLMCFVCPRNGNFLGSWSFLDGASYREPLTMAIMYGPRARVYIF